MRFTILLFLNLHFVSSFAQDTFLLTKWKKAVVNLELRGLDTNGYLNYDTQFKRDWRRLDTLKQIGKITPEQYFDSMHYLNLKSPRQNQTFSSGTSIFVKKGNKRYLITARHVVHDAVEAGFRFNYKIDSSYDFDRIYSTIFIVPNYDEVIHDTSTKQSKIITTTGEIQGKSEKGIFSLYDSSNIKKEVISNKSLFGPTAFGVILNTKKDCYPYTFSNSNYDLAVLSLDNQNAFYAGPSKYKNLGDYLIAIGYVPISYNDINDGPSFEGKDVFTVGFPGSTSIVNRPKLKEEEKTFISILNSLPVFSFGKIAMNNHNLNYFWTDISIYPGNSGGPIIEDGKLIGVVSGQAIVEGTRIPFGLIIKAKYIKELIKIQDEKDKCLGQ